MRMKMRTINKRGLLSFLLTLIMIIGVLPLSAPTVSAEDGHRAVHMPHCIHLSSLCQIRCATGETSTPFSRR